MAASVYQLTPRRHLHLVGGTAMPRATGRQYDFAAMVALLALDHRDGRTQLDHLRALARDANLPLPLNARVRCGHVVSGPGSIGRRSVWCALEVDAWLDGRRNPPPVMAALHLPHDVRLDMAERARALGAGR